MSNKGPKNEKSKGWCITMPQGVVDAIDEKRGTLPRSTWLRIVALKELGLLKLKMTNSEKEELIAS